MSRILVFRIWGDYAHFKKHYTTTSPLTFEFPPPPTVIGIISAIIGLDKEEYLLHFQDPEIFRLSVVLDMPVKKVRWTQNLVDTKKHFWRIYNRTQIRIEFLKDASYIIYFKHNDQDIYNKLRFNLENHQSVYSISLGLSELLANYEYLGEYEIEPDTRNKWVEVDSIIPCSKLLDYESIKFETEREIFKVNYPIIMQSDRVVIKREDILFERKGKPLQCRLTEYWKTGNGEKIVFF